MRRMTRLSVLIILSSMLFGCSSKVIERERSPLSLFSDAQKEVETVNSKSKSPLTLFK